MPWTAADADRHSKGLTDAQKQQWAAVANSALARCQREGGADCEGAAIRQANSVVGKRGHILKREAMHRYTLGVVYEPLRRDAQDDWTDAAEIEKTCWDFMRQLQGRYTKAGKMLLDAVVKVLDGGATVRLDLTDVWDEIVKGGLNDMHINTPVDDQLGDIVECYIAPVDFEIKGVDGVEQVTKGTWLLGVVWTPDHFAKIECGERTGLSLEGRARRLNEDVPQIG